VCESAFYHIHVGVYVRRKLYNKAYACWYVCENFKTYTCWCVCQKEIVYQDMHMLVCM